MAFSWLINAGDPNHLQPAGMILQVRTSISGMTCFRVCGVRRQRWQVPPPPQHRQRPPPLRPQVWVVFQQIYSLWMCCGSLFVNSIPWLYGCVVVIVMLGNNGDENDPFFYETFGFRSIQVLLLQKRISSKRKFPAIFPPVFRVRKKQRQLVLRPPRCMQTWQPARLRRFGGNSQQWQLLKW